MPSASQPRPTIYDVAERAGVSKSLVSMVIRGAEGVSEKRRDAVLSAIADLGYRPSTAAATLAGTRSRTVGLVIEDFSNLWFVDLLHGMREVLEPAGLHVIVGDRQMTTVTSRDAVHAFASMRVETLVLALDPSSPLELPQGVRCLTAGERLNIPPVAGKVANDDVEGGRLATRHLLGLGHTTIAHVTGAGGAAAARRRGYEEAMAEAGRAPVVVGGERPTNEHGADASVRELLATDARPTAIFAANDAMALGTMGALRAAGLSVPHDVSVVGYDASPLAGTSYLDLTTVDGRNLDVGREIARLVIEPPTDDEPVETLLEPSLVVRSTTAPPVR